jgi:uncharacterized protein YlaI
MPDETQHQRCADRLCCLHAGHDGPHDTTSRRTPEGSCRTKRRYPTETTANVIAADAFRLRGHELRAYLCDECQGWHLTHRDARLKPGWRPPEPSRAEKARLENRKRRAGKRRGYPDR